MSGTWKENGTQTLTITSGSAVTTSSVLDYKDYAEVGFIFPTMTTGSVSFDVSSDGDSFSRLVGSAGVEPKLAVGTGGLAFGGFPELKAYSYLRLVTATQAAARSVTALLKS